MEERILKAVLDGLKRYGYDRPAPYPSTAWQDVKYDRSVLYPYSLAFGYEEADAACREFDEQAYLRAPTSYFCAALAAYFEQEEIDSAMAPATAPARKSSI